MTAVALALLASACWGVSDFGGGLLSRRLPVLVIMLGQQLAGAIIIGAVVLAVGDGPPDGHAIGLSMLAGALGALGLGVFYYALSVGTMSIVAPISASGAVFPVIVGLATGDRPTAVQGVGLVLTFAGVVLASREAAAATEGAPTDAARRARMAVPLALLAALFLGGFFTASDVAADDSVLWLLLLSRCTAVPLLAAAYAARRPEGLPAGRQWPAIAAVGALDLGATGLYALANTQGLLAIVAVVGALYPVTTVLLARAVLHERLQRIQAAGVVLAFVGVAAVAAGG